MGGLVHSQRVLLALTQAGASREDSYRLVQRNAMKVWESNGQLSLLELLKNDPEVSALLSDEQLGDGKPPTVHGSKKGGRAWGASSDSCGEKPENAGDCI